MTKKLTDLFNIGVLRRWVRTQTAKVGLNVVFTDCDTPYTGPKCIYLPFFNESVTEEDEARIRFFVLHECLHHVEGGEVFDLMKSYKLSAKHPLGAILNIIEDQRIEQAGAARYAGDATIISAGREIAAREALAHVRKLAASKPTLHDETLKMQAVFMGAGLAQATWCDGVAVLNREYNEVLQKSFPKAVKYFKRLAKELDFVPVTNNLKSCEESFSFAKEVYGLLWDKAPEEVNEEIAAGKCGSGEAEEGEAKEGDGASSKCEGSLKDGERDPRGGVDPRSGKWRIPVESFVKSHHVDKPGEPSGHGLGLDYTNYRGTCHFDPDPFDEMTVIDYTTYPVSRKGYRSIGGRDGDGLVTSASFSNRVRRYLQVKSAAHYVGGHKRGAIHTKTLYRAGMPQVGDGDWNRKVYRRKHEGDTLNTSVSLLVDMSGSMCGDKAEHATKSAMLLNHVISNVLRINTEILTFSFSGGHTIMGLIKPFGVRVPDGKVLERFEDFSTRMWGNADADAILFAYDRLLRQNTKKKVLIVFSDGSPADGWGATDCHYALRKVVAEIEAGKRADIIGIGIMDRNVVDFYKKHLVINRAEELEDAMLKVVTSNVVEDK